MTAQTLTERDNQLLTVADITGHIGAHEPCAAGRDRRLLDCAPQRLPRKDSAPSSPPLLSAAH